MQQSKFILCSGSFDYRRAEFVTRMAWGRYTDKVGHLHDLGLAFRQVKLCDTNTGYLPSIVY